MNKINKIELGTNFNKYESKSINNNKYRLNNDKYFYFNIKCNEIIVEVDLLLEEFGEATLVIRKEKINTLIKSNNNMNFNIIEYKTDQIKTIELNNDIVYYWFNKDKYRVEFLNKGFF